MTKEDDEFLKVVDMVIEENRDFLIRLASERYSLR